MSEAVESVAEDMSEAVETVAEDTREVLKVSGKVTKIAQAVIDGTSHFYLMIEGSDEIFGCKSQRVSWDCQCKKASEHQPFSGKHIGRH